MIKAGDRIKVMCIDNTKCENTLTKGKIYDADYIIRKYIDVDICFYKITNDMGKKIEIGLHFNHLKPLADIREEQMKSILDE
jgi:hypothetical protein